ncbi:MAG TPA: hypothetical protein PKD75_10895 [Tepidiformaceae bacterium]|jgi:hypothetical protein|nr:hypothetical protein [Tepidiformaceae bacterium]
MTDASTPAGQQPSLWSEWAEATGPQRAHFNTLAGHYAWSRICSGCGEGDFLERRHKPVNDDPGLSGRRMPVLPVVIEEGARRGRFRTPAHRIHVCAVTRAKGKN